MVVTMIISSGREHLSKMATKIVKSNGAQPDEFELTVAQEIANLEVRDWFSCSFSLSEHHVTLLMN